MLIQDYDFEYEDDDDDQDADAYIENKYYNAKGTCASHAAIKATQPDEALRELQDILDAETDMTEWYGGALMQGVQGAQAADQDPFPPRAP